MQSMMIPPGQHQLPPLPYPYNALEPNHDFICVNKNNILNLNSE